MVAADFDFLLRQRTAAAALFVGLALAPVAHAQEAAAPPAQRIDIWEYRVEGAKTLPQMDVERAVYPFLGPRRTIEEVERARAALEKAYTDRGFQTVSVEVPEQQVQDGIVVLKVTEGEVGRLRVRGSRYFSLDQIREEAPSLAEGAVPNFNDVTQDIVGLNQQPDRRVTPSLRAGVVPGTVDVDLNVEDTFPLHGTIELNNQYSANTKPLRLNASLTYSNLWQLGHSMTLSYQVAPENPDDAQVYSGSYLMRFPRVSWFSLLLSASKNDSDISTLGNTNVIGRGETIGFRGLFTLPSGADGPFQQIIAGMDYKHNEEIVAGENAPLTYYPINFDYSATWADEAERTQTQAGLGLVFNPRGMGSDDDDFRNKRHLSGGNFLVMRGNLSHERPLFGGVNVMGRLQGQVANKPLPSSEQFSAGGASSVRGYLESEVLGDDGVMGTVELRSPSLNKLGGDDWSAGVINDWQVYAFADGATLAVQRPLSEEDDAFNLASVGLGTSIRLVDYLNGSVDVGIPLITQGETKAGDPRVHFRVWGEF